MSQVEFGPKNIYHPTKGEILRYHYLGQIETTFREIGSRLRKPSIILGALTVSPLVFLPQNASAQSGPDCVFFQDEGYFSLNDDGNWQSCESADSTDPATSAAFATEQLLSADVIMVREAGLKFPRRFSDMEEKFVVNNTGNTFGLDLTDPDFLNNRLVPLVNNYHNGNEGGGVVFNVFDITPENWTGPNSINNLRNLRNAGWLPSIRLSLYPDSPFLDTGLYRAEDLDGKTQLFFSLIQNPDREINENNLRQLSFNILAELLIRYTTGPREQIGQDEMDTLRYIVELRTNPQRPPMPIMVAASA